MITVGLAAAAVALYYHNAFVDGSLVKFLPPGASHVSLRESKPSLLVTPFVRLTPASPHLAAAFCAALP